MIGSSFLNRSPARTRELLVDTVCCLEALFVDCGIRFHNLGCRCRKDRNMIFMISRTPSPTHIHAPTIPHKNMHTRWCWKVGPLCSSCLREKKQNKNLPNNLSWRCSYLESTEIRYPLSEPDQCVTLSTFFREKCKLESGFITTEIGYPSWEDFWCQRIRLTVWKSPQRIFFPLVELNERGLSKLSNLDWFRWTFQESTTTS